jgi:hypothetical protein
MKLKLTRYSKIKSSSNLYCKSLYAKNACRFGSRLKHNNRLKLQNNKKSTIKNQAYSEYDCDRNENSPDLSVDIQTRDVYENHIQESDYKEEDSSLVYECESVNDNIDYESEHDNDDDSCLSNNTTLTQKTSNAIKYEDFKSTEYIQNFTIYFISQRGNKHLYDINRIIQFLIWTYTENNQQNKLSISNIEKWTYELFSKHINLIYAYVTKYLHSYLQNAYTTIKLFVNECLHIYYTWFSFIKSKNNDKYKLNYEHHHSYAQSMIAIKQLCNKHIKRNKYKTKTKKFYVENMRLPEGDSLTVIKDIVETRYNAFVNIDTNSINERTYIRYMQLLCASCYISFQGRIQAVMDMKIKDVKILLDPTTYHEADAFKNSGSLGFQAVIIHPLCM